MAAVQDAAVPPGWDTVAATWPHAAHSRFIRSGLLTWHVQRMGEVGTPVCLLVHGTGASTHSWAGMMPKLAQNLDIIAIDLPGHGFTTEGRGRTLTLPGMAEALGSLLDVLEVSPTIAVGHSAGAAILIEATLSGAVSPAAIVGLNSALEPIEGNAIFSPLAKALFVNPFTAQAVAFQSRITPMTRRLLARTNSKIDEAGISQYETLVAKPSHVAGALGMMANWNLVPLRERMPELKTPLTLVVTEDDAMVPARVSKNAAKLTKSATVLSEATGGHLAHEAEPAKFVEIIEKVASSFGVLDAERDRARHSSHDPSACQARRSAS